LGFERCFYENEIGNLALMEAASPDLEKQGFLP
jgi:hypothetical protein